MTVTDYLKEKGVDKRGADAYTRVPLGHVSVPFGRLTELPRISNIDFFWDRVTG